MSVTPAPSTGSTVQIGCPRNAVDVRAAVNEQRVAGEVAASLGGQEDRDRRDVGVGVSHPAHRVGRVGEGLELGVVADRAEERLALGRRADGVDGDPRRRPLTRGGAGEGTQRLLGRVVLQQAHVCVDAVEAAHVDDPAPAPLLHVGERCGHRPERPEVADLHPAQQCLVGLGLDPADRAAAPGVVDHDVDRSVRRHRGGDRPLDLLADRHVTGDEAPADRLGDRPAGGLVELGHDDPGPLVGEPAGDALADAGARAGHQGDPAVELAAHRPLTGRSPEHPCRAGRGPARSRPAPGWSAA